MSAVSQKLKREDVLYTASGMSLLSHAKPKDYLWLNYRKVRVDVLSE